MDVAALTLNIDSSPIRKASDDLERFKKAANDAGTTADRTGRESKRGGEGIRAMGSDARRTGSDLSLLTTAARRLAGALALAFGAGRVTQDALAFSSAMAEVSTLVDEAAVSMDDLTQKAIEQSRAFGSAPVEQAKAFYQIISAGASSAAEANDILTASNKLAVGGVTDVATAADGLTSVLNAYGDKVESATAVADALFAGMRAGKTTIGELSAGLGKVAPLAAQTGVAFDELVAAVSALTKGGISTQESITGVRAILAAVAKPTSEATKLAGQLGLQFDAAALKAKGFQGFIDELVRKTGGSTEALAQLFGGVEALVPIMALSGQAGADFAAIMGDMGQKAGMTQEAFDKMVSSPGFQLAQLFNSIKLEAMELATGLLTMLVPAMKAANENLSTIVSVIKAVVAGLVIYKIAALAGAAATVAMSGQFGVLMGIIGTTTAQFGLLAGAQVTASAAAAGLTSILRSLMAVLLANPFTAVAVALGALTAAMVLFGNETDKTRQKNEELIASLKTLASVRGAEFEAKLVEAQTARNQARDELTRLELAQQRRAASPELAQRPMPAGANAGRMQELRWQIVELDGAIRGANHVAEANAKISEVQAVAVESVAAATTSAAGATKAKTEAMSAEAKEMQRRSEDAQRFIADLDLEIARIGLNEKALRSLEIARAMDTAATDMQRQKIEELGEARERALAADSARQEATAFNANLEALRRQRGEIGLTGQALEEYRYISDRLNEANRHGEVLTDAQTAAIARQAAEYAKLKTEVESADAAWKRIVEQSEKAVSDWLARQREQLNAARQVVGGFFADWTDGIRSGMNIFKSFTDSVISGLNRIIDRLMDKTINTFLDSLFAGSGGGGFLGAILGGGSARPNALGGAYSPAGSINRFAKGGAFTNSVVSTPTLFRFAKGGALGEMGEAGPEAIMPLKRGPNGALGVQASGGGSKKAVIQIEQNFNMEGVMTPNDVVAMVRQGATAAVEEVKRNLDVYLNEWDVDGAVAT